MISQLSKMCLPLSCLLLAGCAGAPAFRMSLPDTIDTQGKAIAIVGDLQQTAGFVRFARNREENSVQQQRLVADLTEHLGELAALIIVGDLVFTARSQRDWAHFDSLISPIAERVPVLPTPGNHDYPCFLVQFCRTKRISAGMQQRFPWLRPGVPWSVDAGSLLLIFIDSERDYESQGRWLREQLDQAAGRYAAALVSYHRPAFSYSMDRGAGGHPEVQRHIVPALNESPLPAIAFSGHIHGFEHIVRDGVHHITTAGGGGPRGPMPVGNRPDAYSGRDCIRERDGAVLRPFNYLLLRQGSNSLQLEVRGFCRGDASVSVLDSIEIELRERDQ